MEAKVSEQIDIDKLGKKDKRAAFWRRNKYKVSPPGERTARGRIYASKAEKQYADALWLLVDKRPDGIDTLIEQPKVRLGEDAEYRPDFLVIPFKEEPYFVDVKGAETKEFGRIKILWAKYANRPLRIVKRGRVVETIWRIRAD